MAVASAATSQGVRLVASHERGKGPDGFDREVACVSFTLPIGHVHVQCDILIPQVAMKKTLAEFQLVSYIPWRMFVCSL